MDARNDCAGWRVDRWNRIEAVRRYVDGLTDPDMMAVAFLMMRGVDSAGIMKMLKLEPWRFSSIRECLAFGLLFSGIAVRD